ncbi:MAG: hypothetical protein QOD00_95, partial [Blastocatellia bacterium]|nr:hypothetical protein [Blastocatellia bacterium]
GMLFHSEYSAGSVAYQDIFSFHLRARLDLDALIISIEQLTLRHPALRASFDLSNFSEPLQLIHRAVAVALRADDLRHLSFAEQEAHIAAWREDEKLRRIDWSSPPLLSFQIQRRSEETFQLHLSFHHAILDGWSVASMLAELFKIYFANLGEQSGPLEPPPVITQRDFVTLERRALVSAEVNHYWTGKLRDLTISKLPRLTSSSSPETPPTASHARIVNVPLTQEVSDHLNLLAGSASVPVKSVLLAAHLRVMSLLSGDREVLTGLVSNGRPEQTDGERALGLFLNTLPFRASLAGGSWRELVQQTFAAEREMLPFRWHPLADLQKKAGGEILFETGFNFNHFHVYEAMQHAGRVQVLDHRIFEQTNFTLGAIFSQHLSSNLVRLQLNYNAAELTEEQIEAISIYYQKILRAMAFEPEASYETVCPLSDAEQRQQLIDWNRTAAAYPDDTCLHQWFEAQAERRPDATAVVYEQQQMSYAELNRKANQLAHYLQTIGVGPESLVGICIERSLEMMVGLLGILKAGGAYLPLDPHYPRERLSFMLTDARVKVLLTQHSLLSFLPEHEAKVVCLDTDWQLIAGQSTEQPSSKVTAENLAYVIYTSGSTGRPKGVMLSHGGVCNTLRWRQAAFSLQETDRMLQNISIAFDPSVWQIFGALVTGYELVLARPEGHKDIRYLSGLIEEHKITLADFVPSMMQAFLEEQSEGACESLRHVFCGGEVLPVELQERFFSALPGGELHNMYGPTECSIDAVCWTCQPGSNERVPIGRPVANKLVYIPDEYQQPVPVGVAGQLHVGGVGLARGYFNRPELTAEQFIPNPFSSEPGARLYRTGDRVRYLPDGRIEYLGRMDKQLKIRGFRIEPGEIENMLVQHEAVRESVVLARDQGKDDKRLVAYLVMNEDSLMTAGELRGYLRERLPPHMVPSSFVILKELPLLPNGKLDTDALPEPDATDAESVAYLAPRTEAEQAIAEVWREALRIERVGVDDNFFDLGGHSILMLRVHSRLREIFQLDISILDM